MLSEGMFGWAMMLSRRDACERDLGFPRLRMTRDTLSAPPLSLTSNSGHLAAITT